MPMLLQFRFKIVARNFLLAGLCYWMGLAPTRLYAEEEWEWVREHFTLQVKTEPLRVWVHTQQGTITPHPEGSIVFGEAADPDMDMFGITNWEIEDERRELITAWVENERGQRARLEIQLADHYFALELAPESNSVQDKRYRIDFRTEGLSPAYGLGDHGGYGDNMDVTGFVNDDFGNRDNHHRFISTFTIFPSHGFAQVLFSEKTKRVAVTHNESRLGVAAERSAKVYYFVGSPPTIYETYKAVRNKEGYPDVKPRYRFYELGYEAFGSLGWNTYQTSVQGDIARYIKEGYPLRWSVVGSGFWKGERRNPLEGATTSFGIWDDTAGKDRNDGLPNPRYPSPEALKEFLKSNDIKLFLGLRINFKAPPKFNGYLYGPHDGHFSAEGLSKDYFVRNEGGVVGTFRVNFPQGNVFLLESKNKDAVNWYTTAVDRWGASGFKEDLMLHDGAKLNNDAKLNPVNEALANKGYLIMARNSAYSVSGDILRLEDTQHGFDQDRPLINGLNYAASGTGAVYLDIVAGKYLENPLTEDQKLYFVRNAMTVAVSPVMAMGHGPWHLEDPSYERAVKKAVDWRVEHTPYIYSEIVRGYETGFPYAMTPLPLKFPADTHTYRLAGKSYRQYSWMVGESLLATPLFGNDYASATHRNVYLPVGRWMDYETKKWYEGPLLLTDYAFPIDKVPVFIGGQGVLVRNNKGDGLSAQIYPASDQPYDHTFYFADGESSAVIKKDFHSWEKGVYKVRVSPEGYEQELRWEDMSQTLTFGLEPAKVYHITYLGNL